MTGPVRDVDDVVRDVDRCAWCDEPMADGTAGRPASGMAWWGEPACSLVCRAGLDAELEDDDV